jgi:flagellar motor switch protein FliN/FliY
LKGEAMTDNAVKTVTVELSVVLGRSQMPIHQLLKMGRGAVIELDTTVNDHAFIYANDTLIARGEVLVIDDHVGITITDTVAPSGD